jgi:hypothetical protein
LEEIMSRKSFVVTLAFATLAVPAFADVPDGRGGRTAPWKANQPAAIAAATHACCDAVVAPAERIVSGPAELKALGHVAWVSRNERPSRISPCYKRVAHRPATYSSPAELKALGHVAARNVVSAPSATRICCESGRCPMSPKATASR